MTSRRVEHGLGEKQRTGGERIAENFLEKPSRIGHASGHEANHNSKALRAVLDALGMFSQRLEGSSDDMLADVAGAPQARVVQERELFRWRWDGSDMERTVPARMSDRCGR